MACIIYFMQLIQYNKLLLPVYAVAGLFTYLIMLRLLKAVRGADIELLGKYLGRLTWASKVLSLIILPRSSASER